MFMKSSPNSTKHIKVILVESDPIFRNIQRDILEKDYSCKIIAEAENDKQFYTISDFESADYLIVNLNVRDLDVYKAVLELSWFCPKLKIIAVTLHLENISLFKLVKSGVKGCVTVDKFSENIGETIGKIESGLCFFEKGIIVRTLNE